MTRAANKIAMAAEALVRSVVSKLPGKQTVSAVAAEEKPFDIRAIDGLGAAIVATQLHNLSTPELICNVIALLTDIRQFGGQLANVIAAHHRMGATHFSEFFETLENVQVAITETSKGITARVSQT